MFCVVDPDPVLLELGLVDGTVIPVPGEAVKGVHDNSFKLVLLAVFNHPLELRALVSLAGYGPVAVFPDYDDFVLVSEVVTLPKLALNGFLPLVMARIASINYRFRRITSSARFLRTSSIGTTLDSRRNSTIPLQFFAVLKLIHHRHELVLVAPGEGTVDTENVFFIFVLGDWLALV